jgi:hypothetical protein
MTTTPPPKQSPTNNGYADNIATMEFRMEHDLIGDEQVPKDAYYGIQTQRA